MQDKEKFIDLISDQTFLERIIGLDTIKEVQSAFKEKDIDMGVEKLDELRKLILKIKD